ncbi:hypothetical protein ACFOG5_06280 [Pedobacter fastidiosus]|uniref:Uncharacterized protein n=1 Tax=Pedobacter fastidiosus TaxID=2765361 RepID=A0ABR7KXV6_9SPHI|nr:hypothetical protein [Pedobacter fastidiosus]MBC6112911.1 hypothetical protein [Pedobacter fastidiosus]
MYIRNEGLVTGLKYAPGTTATTGKVDFVYNLPHYVSTDYYEIQSKIVNAYAVHRALNISDRMKEIVTTPFMPVRKGSYKFKVSYVLPGTNRITTTKQLVINNEIGQ